MKNFSKYYFCVDGGETKSQAILYDSNRKILGKSKSDSGNIFNDVYIVERNIKKLWVDCCKKANLKKDKINSKTIASFGLAGARYKKGRKYLEKKINFFSKLIISSDGHIALAATYPEKQTAILNIGTGLVAHLILKNNYSQQISGWGYPFGDKAGGWWIGFRMIQETIKAIDGYNNINDVIVKNTLKITGKKDLKILNWLSEAKPYKLAKLSKIFFSDKSKSLIFNKILNESLNEIELILEYIIIEKKIKKIIILGGLSSFYKPYFKKKFQKFIVNQVIDPLNGALNIAQKKFPLEKLINDNRNY
tara:strand:+ start:1123 stop:2040 length:918 start_codon:yes stop_codon:yes gene_type:complete